MHQLTCRSKLCSRVVPCRDAVSRKSGAVFPGLKGGQQEPHPVVTCSVVSGQKGRPATAPEVSWKLTLCSQSFLRTSSSPRQLLPSMVHTRFGVWAE
ncbi:hypothetical protein ATANTOWER_031437 [Ataeniobius toweri]|uniref:Uncharacterized protein n=1 Tax=Ataeniobius toweri TaxID=208326 RepID=A0ABU7C380_9TELE|nr:hypothetical protein [Ataeniobius toweri]